MDEQTSSVVIAHGGKVIARDFMTSYPSGEPAWKPGIKVPDNSAVGFRWTGSITPLIGFLLWASQHRPTGIRLVLPFLPMARQDKISGTSGDQGSGVRGLMRMIRDALGSSIYRITVLDPHSGNTLHYAGLEGITIHRCHICYATPFELLSNSYDLVIGPDQGARERASDVARELGVPLVCGYKSRDLDTGRLTGLEFDYSAKRAIK